MIFPIICALLIAGKRTTIAVTVTDAFDLTTVPLCCPSADWKLARITADVQESPKYVCLPQAYDTNATQSPAGPKEGSFLFENSSPVYGLGIRLAEDHMTNSSIPECDNQILNRFARNDEVEIASDACVMGVQDELVTVSCPQEDPKWRPITFAQKCCPNNFIYDGGQRKCVQSSDAPNFQLYQEFFQTAVVFNDNAIECPRNKVLVEYKLTQYKFTISNGSIHLRTLNKKFGPSQYCVEAIDNVPYETEQEFLVRTCDDISSACRRMPCIRRCCNDGEMFTKGNATSYCKRDESDTTFHSFESLDISGNFSKPPVFGVLRSLDCLKYRLDPEAYADEAHTISERDGSLLVASTKKHYTNNQYCVEKIRNATWADQKLYTFLCFDSKVVGNDRIRFRLYTIGLLISCSFYAATLVVYLSIARLRNLPGKILICLVSSLFTAYLGIALGQLMPTPNDTVCFASGFFIYFCLMAAFSWMNVTCFDIWQTFG
ncbi:uncharacterized protein LOC133325812 [Musca vetustissima]|uniref:uncharacterized protein LOC133325812 n=1 Tax=Musca vetustissima TaxID=27455 RepID=UPI002AB75104|nr:uncharacterized protein LOC133325812 [Musca vetustissima]